MRHPSTWAAWRAHPFCATHGGVIPGRSMPAAAQLPALHNVPSGGAGARVASCRALRGCLVCALCLLPSLLLSQIPFSLAQCCHHALFSLTAAYPDAARFSSLPCQPCTASSVYSPADHHGGKELNGGSHGDMPGHGSKQRTNRGLLPSITTVCAERAAAPQRLAAHACLPASAQLLPRLLHLLRAAGTLLPHSASPGQLWSRVTRPRAAPRPSTTSMW